MKNRQIIYHFGSLYLLLFLLTFKDVIFGGILLNFATAFPISCFSTTIMLRLFFDVLNQQKSIVDLEQRVTTQKKSSTKHRVLQYDGEKGLARLNKLLAKAKKVDSVWFSKPGYNTTFSKLMLNRDKAIVENLANAGSVREFFTNRPAFLDNLVANKIQSTSFSEGYKAFQIPTSMPACPNFTILELENRTKEVWFGWVDSPTKQSTKNFCMRTRDSRIVKLFETWREVLLVTSSTYKPYVAFR